LDDRLRTNIAAFHSDVNGLQRAVTIQTEFGTASQLIENTADVTIQGVELEASYIVSDDFTVNGFFGYLDSEFDEILFDLSGDGVVDDADFDLELPNLAKFSAGTSIDYIHALENGEVGLNASYSYRSSAETGDNNGEGTREGERHIINASLGYTTEDGRWKASIYGKNLANEILLQTITIFPGFTSAGGDGGTIQTPQKGRVFGAEVTYNF